LLTNRTLTYYKQYLSSITSLPAATHTAEEMT